MNLVQALSNTGHTANGAITNKKTLNACLDLFWQAPTENELETIEELYNNAMLENHKIATQLSFWLRDPRQGAGRRTNGRLLTTLLSQDLEFTESSFKNFLHAITHFGRFDDLLFLLDTNHAEIVSHYWMSQIRKGNALAAKWAPRESSTNKRYARIIAKNCYLSMKDYRKVITKASSTVEQLMCSKKWEDIVFEHVPSQAMRRLRKAFAKHQDVRFAQYNEEVASGTKSINASTLYPHQILGECVDVNLGCGFYEKSIAQAVELDPTMTNLWNNQPNWVQDVPTLVVADTSGSMSGLPMQIAVSLAIYTAQRLPEPWKNSFITFSSRPSFVTLDESLTIAQNITKIPSIIENTDLNATFELILNTAKRNRISQEQMPSQIVIISDMQFDHAQEGKTNFEVIEAQYRAAGYTRPNLVFWNVNSRFKSTCPVTFDEAGTALVAGYSPSILKSISGGNMDPIAVMLSTLERYPDSF